MLQPAGHRLARQSDRQPVDAVKVSAVLIDMIPEPVDSPVPTGLTGANISINVTSPLVWQMASEDNFYMEEVVVADCDYVVGGPTCTCLKSAGLIVDLAGGVTVGVSFPADLAGDVIVGVSCPADLTRDVTVGVSSQADLAGGVTVRVVLSAVAGVASSADLAGDISVGMMSSAVAEAASLADLAEVASSADLAEVASSVLEMSPSV